MQDERRDTAVGSAGDIRARYDEAGAAELERLVKDGRGRVSFEVHRRFLRRYVRPDWRVLEIGAGPGRFTVELARLGARVVTTDLSPVQLRLNADFVAEAGAEDAVESREVLDLRDARARYGTGAFDCVVAYGGPLSYLFEGEEEALSGLLDVLRPDGVLLASVMSLYGTWRAEFTAGVAIDFARGSQVTQAILESGDLRHLPNAQHVCRMFTWEQVQGLIRACGAEPLAASASNWASLGDRDALARLEADPERWSRFLEQEAEMCAAPGALDGGTHILFAAARPAAG
ncbi:class I SAM-dependent methyltransferase [Streptomyces sp. NPDC051940]|uniref:class I SAM-dependent methyltransferase n=1 Tax=Streptomyces sp. NPDC051940 TaxID=3155675 RepID=UPI00341B6D9B